MSLPRPPTHLLGATFGMLTVNSLEHVQLSGRGRWRYMANCTCECGSAKPVITASLLRGATTSCGCRRDHYAKTSGKNNGRYTGFEEIRGKFWMGYRRGAQARGHAFTITIQYAWGLYQQQKGTCALSGVAIVFASGRNSRTSASIDRIDPAIGYVDGNIQWVHKTVNLMRNILGVEEFVMWCERVSDNASVIRSGRRDAA